MVKKNSGEFTLSHLEMDFEPLFNFQKCDWHVKSIGLEVTRTEEGRCKGHHNL